jgi:hypothetical protein
VVAGAALSGGLMLAMGTGFSVVVGGVLIRAHQPWPLLGLAVISAAASLWTGGAARVRIDLESAWAARSKAAPWLAAAAVAFAVLIGFGMGTWCASGADSYGYVSQSQLWRTGALVRPQPLARLAPWPSPEWTLSPLGFRPAVAPGAIVPTYPPGLPLVMAGASIVAGFDAVFWVVPILGGVAVWLTFRLGRHLADPLSAAIGAVLLAVSPVFLYQVVQPMSDVPVTAWWVGALTGVLSGHPLAAGLCAAAAVLTRPNLGPLTGWLLAGLVWRMRSEGGSWASVMRSAALYIVPVVAGVGGLAWLNTYLYGHPLASGYGTAAALFSVANVAINVRHYLGWLWSVQTPFVFIALLAPGLWQPDHRDGAAASAPAVRPWTTLFALGFSLFVFASYLPYSPFEEWWYLRFLLPGLPIMLVLATAVALRPFSFLPAAWRLPLAVAGTSLLAGHALTTAADGGVMALRALESRYAAAGAYVAGTLPPAAVLLSVQESGSLRIYGGRTTIRFDHLEPDGLDRAVAFLQQAGYRPYFALEDWEEAQFRSRFASGGALGRLDWPPAAEVGGPVKVRFYDPRDRARYLAGETVRTVKDHPAGPARGR